jgi:hypothetical protein
VARLAPAATQAMHALADAQTQARLARAQAGIAEGGRCHSALVTYLATISDSKLNTFRRLFGPPFTIAKGY